MKIISTTLRMPKILHSTLKEKAKNKGLTLNAYILIMLDNSMKKSKKELGQ